MQPQYLGVIFIKRIFKAILGYTASPCLKNKDKTKQKPKEIWILANVYAAGSKEQGPRQRRRAAPAEKKSGAEIQHEGVELRVKNLEAVQTDFSAEPLQKVVCFNHDNTLLATGGTDGHVRVWKVWLWGLKGHEL